MWPSRTAKKFHVSKKEAIFLVLGTRPLMRCLQEMDYLVPGAIYSRFYIRAYRGTFIRSTLLHWSRRHLRTCAFVW